MAPLDTINFHNDALYSFVLRFAIGITGSTFIFLIVKRFDHTPFIQRFSKYGKYTLAFYTITTVINGFTRKFLSFIDFDITNPLLLETASIIFTFIQMFMIYKFAKQVEKNKELSKLLLGN